MQSEDPFVKTYMDWLAHHEFGLGHKPFRFDAGTAEPRDQHLIRTLWNIGWTVGWIITSMP